ncbi:TlpA family protein disulfide reductase [Lutibacter holmesii]|uniref:TlpA family protein disulfide reductase n=1 Tax=Lutibacter holmesii TaxID=1137985 RepID=A0ABW3WQU4_9FLAO
MKKLLLLFFAIAITACKPDPKPLKKVAPEKKTEATTNIEIIDYKGLETILSKNDDKTYVINFWATWCKPCVEELPAFEKLHENYKDKNVEVILVSLDFTSHIETRLLPFIKEHNLKPKVVVMGDPDQNTWIPKVSTEWSGAIPATVIYNKNNRKFYEQSFTYELLENEITKIN